MIGAIMAKRKARASFECLNRRDIEGFLADWAEDAHMIHPGDVPGISGEMEGKEAAREWLQKFLDRFPGIAFSLTSVCVENIFAFGGTNMVIAEWDIVLNGHQGQEWRNRGITVSSVRKGKVMQVRNYIFDAEVHRQAWGAA